MDRRSNGLDQGHLLLRAVEINSELRVVRLLSHGQNQKLLNNYLSN